MIKLSSFPFKIQKVPPKTSDNISTSIMLQWWLIRQVMAWVYTYTTLWLKVLRKIENIIREEMNNYWCYEILMPGISPQNIWETTWRWDIEEYFKLPTYDNKFYRLNPTHEEIVVPLMKQFISSYKDLPVCVYQIQTKYRNEKRAKSWLLRWREFLMKDAYSFHTSNEDFEKFYNWMIDVYKSIFNRLWIWKDTYLTYADWWTFTEKYSHEFQTLLPIWEDTIYICENCQVAHNKEIVKDNFKCIKCGWTKAKIEKASEVWNIFPLETKYSKPFDLTVLDENWKEKDVIMWCYWIWVSRLMGVIAEYFTKDNTIFWPENIAPANYYIIVLQDNLDKAIQLAKKLENEWKEVILDDRQWKKYWFGVKIKDAEVLWIPNIIIISDKTIEKWWYELKKLWEKEGKIISF